MHDGKKELPEMYRTILALLVFEDVPPLPLTGFLAETIDTHEKYFHAFNRIGYSTESAIQQNLFANGTTLMRLPRDIV